MNIILSFLLGSAVSATGGIQSVTGAIFLNLSVLMLVLAYYFFMEHFVGRSIGKMITKTRVVHEDGGKPSFSQILGRTFARLIPFEAFSFLGEKGIGWHDSLSKTRVIKG